MSSVDEPTRELASFSLPRIPEVELERELGRGGMGAVYRGRQPYLDRAVAVKLLAQPRGAPATEARSFAERFRREAKILAKLAHPHIVACYQAGVTADGECYLVMELVDGPNLKAWVARSGPLEEAAALGVAREVAMALDYALASGVIHRDVKPENVLLQPLEKPAGARFPYRAKLVDLGLARAAGPTDATSLTLEGTIVGTPSTMAPEQIEDPESVDFRADIYGLGCVLYYALVGEAAFPEPTVTQILARKARGDVPDPLRKRPSLRPEVAALVREMLAPAREDRPQAYSALIERCERLIASASAPPRVSSTDETVSAVVVPAAATAAEATAPAPPPAARPARSSAWTAAALVGVVVLAGFAFARWRRLERVAARRQPPVAARGEAEARPPLSASAFGPAASLLVFGEGDVLPRGWALRGVGAIWGRGEERDSLVGNAGAVRCAIGPPPWRVEGALALHPGLDQIAVRADDATGAGAGVIVQRLTETLSLVLTRFEADAASGRPSPRTSLDSRAAPLARSLRFAVQAEPSRVIIEVEGEPLEEVRTTPLDGLTLIAGKGQVELTDLAVRR